MQFHQISNFDLKVLNLDYDFYECADHTPARISYDLDEENIEEIMDEFEPEDYEWNQGYEYDDDVFEDEEQYTPEFDDYWDY